jgi:hypothetical protein
LAEGWTKIAMQYIPYVNEELLNNGFVDSKQCCILLIDRFHAGRIGHALGKPSNDGCDRISRHQAGKGEIQDKGENKRDPQPKQLVKEILSIPFQRSTSGKKYTTAMFRQSRNMAVLTRLRFTS